MAEVVNALQQNQKGAIGVIITLAVLLLLLLVMGVLYYAQWFPAVIRVTNQMGITDLKLEKYEKFGIDIAASREKLAKYFVGKEYQYEVHVEGRYDVPMGFDVPFTATLLYPPDQTPPPSLQRVPLLLKGSGMSSGYAYTVDATTEKTDADVQRIADITNIRFRMLRRKGFEEEVRGETLKESPAVGDTLSLAVRSRDPATGIQHEYAIAEFRYEGTEGKDFKFTITPFYDPAKVST